MQSEEVLSQITEAGVDEGMNAAPQAEAQLQTLRLDLWFDAVAPTKRIKSKQGHAKVV